MSNPTRSPRTRVLASAVAAFALALAVGAPVAAGSPAHGRITKGDVTAAFQARTTGGYLNGLRGRTIAAPVRGLHDGRISFFGDTSACSRDWHYLGVTVMGIGDRVAARAFLNATSITFAIDGQLVTPTMRTAIKPFVGTGIRGQLGVSVGALIAPGSIPAGAHSLETQIAVPGFPVENVPATFTLSPDFCA